MTLVRFATLFVVGSLAALPVRAAQDPKPVTESVTLKATIEAIDQTSKRITLKGEKGNYVEVDGSSMPRFDQLKVGDVVTATYYESLAVHVRKPGDPAPAAGSAAITPRPGAPGGTAARQRTVTVVIQAIDAKTPSVTVKTADGRRADVPRRGPEEPREGEGWRQGRRHLHRGAAAESGSGR
jgi:Cu/Ag efflux protein CusF